MPVGGIRTAADKSSAAGPAKLTTAGPAKLTTAGPAKFTAPDPAKTPAPKTVAPAIGGTTAKTTTPTIAATKTASPAKPTVATKTTPTTTKLNTISKSTPSDKTVSAAEKTTTTVGANDANNAPGAAGTGRTTFRPPWVKQDSMQGPAPKSTTPSWLKRSVDETNANKENGQPVKEVKLQSREIKVPVMTTKPKPVQVPIKPKEVKVESESETEEETESEEEETDDETEEEEEEEDSYEEELTPRRTPIGRKIFDKNARDKAKKDHVFEKPTLKHVVIPRKSEKDLLMKLEREKNFLEQKPKLKSVASFKEKDPESTEPELRTQKSFLDEMPKLKPVVINKDKQLKSEDDSKIRPVLKKVPKVDESLRSPPSNEDNQNSYIPAPPPPPPGFIGPPPPPPPPALQAPGDFSKSPLSAKQKATIEKLKLRPRRRPDWSEMMQEVESGRKLKHVECNDRSKPILTTKSMTKISGQFVYETEKANIHNILLQQIQGGIRLRPVKCNDRSKPILAGLRKFRRQMTIEEQIQKSESRANLQQEAPVEESEDEMDDIDKLRDDLQSTKQLLAIELRNREAQERENKRLAAKVANLEAELARDKWVIPLSGQPTDPEPKTAGEMLLDSLKKDADEARSTCKELENKYQDVAEKLDKAKIQIEEQKRLIANLEKRSSGQGPIMGNTRRVSEAAQKDSSPEPDLEVSESESEEDEEKKTARLVRRLGREVKMLKTKLIRLKEKQSAAKVERVNLKEAMKKNQILLKEENKKFRKLQKEVDKMAKMLKEDEDDEKEDDEEAHEEGEEEEEEEESEEETESEESDDSSPDTESESEPEDAADDKKKTNLEPRVKRHEGRLTALKKGNYLLQANVDRLQDEISKVKEKAVTLQSDLDSVLNELG